MKKLFLLLPALFAALTFTSCLNSDSDDEQLWNQTFTNNITYAKHIASGDAHLLNGAVYSLSCDLVNNTADLSVANLQLSPSAQAINFTIQGLKWSYNSDGALVITAASTVASQYDITNLNLLMVRRYLPSGYIDTTYSISFNINGYGVRAVQSSDVLTGTTLVKDTQENTSRTLDNPYYAYQLDLATSTATLTAYQFDWNGGLHNSMVVTKVPFTVEASGVRLLLAGPVNPTVDGYQATSTTLSDLSALIDYAGGMTVSFTMDSRFEVVSSLGKPLTNS